MPSLTFLGTGTSNGVPTIGCDCEVCRSEDSRDKRLRTSALLETDAGTRVLIDVGPDFRMQALAHHINHIDGILITHSHQDHIGGIDDLREINFLMKKSIPVYGTELVLNEIRSRFSYIFRQTQTGGGKPQIDLQTILTSEPFFIEEQPVIPFEVFHGEIGILGFKLGRLVYITDASRIPSASIEAIGKPYILVVNALRYTAHPTHFSLKESLAFIAKVQPDNAYLIHMTHKFLHRKLETETPENVAPAYDGLRIEW